MSRAIFLIAACLWLAACKGNDSADATVQGAARPDATEAARADGPSGSPGPGAYQPPVNGFKTPLPAGVQLSRPYKMRMDVAVPNKDGTRGRRTEFAFLEGDAKQAMQDFSTSMVVAGFLSPDGPTDGSGVIRQVFKKPGYGTVFARAETAGQAVLKDQDAKGFLIAAWPSDAQITSPATE